MPLKIGQRPPKQGGSSSNHPFFGVELLVLGSVFYPGSPWPTFLHSLVSEPPFLYSNNLSRLPQEDQLKKGGFNSSSLKNDQAPKGKHSSNHWICSGERLISFCGLAYWYQNHVSLYVLYVWTKKHVCIYTMYVHLNIYIYINTFDNSWVPLMLPMFFCYVRKLIGNGETVVHLPSTFHKLLWNSSWTFGYQTRKSPEEGQNEVWSRNGVDHYCL